MEADVVALQQAAEDFAPPRHHVEHVCRREIGVVEEGDLQIRPQFAQDRRHHPQVVVVQPDGGAGRGFGGGGFGEAAVHVQIGVPVVLAETRALPEGVQHRPEGLLREALVERIDLALFQRHPRHGQIRELLRIDRGMYLEMTLARIIDAPGHPGALAPAAEKSQQARDDAVGRLRLAPHPLAVFDDFLVRQAVVDHHQLGIAGVGVACDLAVRVVGRKQVEMIDCLQDAAAAGHIGVQHMRKLLRGRYQRRLGFAHAHALEAGGEHRQIVERVAGHQHPLPVDAQMRGQCAQHAALVGIRRQDVQVAVGRIQHRAFQFLRGRLDPAADQLQFFRAAEIRAAPFLRHILAHQRIKAGHRIGHGVLAGPARIDFGLQRLHRLQGVTIDHGRADIADHIVRARQGGVGQQRHHVFQPAPGDEGQADVRVAVDQPVKLLAMGRATGQKGAIKIGGQHQRRLRRGAWRGGSGSLVQWISLERGFRRQWRHGVRPGRAASWMRHAIRRISGSAGKAGFARGRGQVQGAIGACSRLHRRGIPTTADGGDMRIRCHNIAA